MRICIILRNLFRSFDIENSDGVSSLNEVLIKADSLYIFVVVRIV